MKFQYGLNVKSDIKKGEERVNQLMEWQKRVQLCSTAEGSKEEHGTL